MGRSSDSAQRPATSLFGEEQMETIIAASVEQVKTLRENRQKSLGREPELGEE
jgi:hypothetical protein